MVYNVLINGYQRTPERDEQIKQLIRDHCLGSVWIQFNTPGADEIMQMVKEVADYPILIITDAEAGMGADYTIGKHNALSSTGDERYAYAFGKAVGVTARKMGYNVVCNPLVDINDNGSPRYLSPDKKVVARFAAAEARGMQDAGILTVGKHYPSAINFNDIDSHMAQSVSVQTKEELLDQCLYAYCELNKQGLLDGVMTGHIKCEKIDPDRPSSLSKPVLDLYREQGFDGFMITDALCMMAIRSQFTDAESSAICIAAGNDIVLPNFRHSTEECFEMLVKNIFQRFLTDRLAVT
jgi:beta-glucosidase-like glycosyl hydrolase